MKIAIKRDGLTVSRLEFLRLRAASELNFGGNVKGRYASFFQSKALAIRANLDCEFL